MQYSHNISVEDHLTIVVTGYGCRGSGSSIRGVSPLVAGMTLRGQAVVRDKVPAAGVHLPPAPAIVRTLDVVVLGVLHKPADGVLGLGRDDPAGVENVGASVRGEVEVVHVLVHGQGVAYLD